MEDFGNRKLPIKRSVPLKAVEESRLSYFKETQGSVEKRRSIKHFPKLLILQNMFLSIFLSQQPRKYLAVLISRLVSLISRGSFCSLFEGPFNEIKDKILADLNASWSVRYC